MLILGGVMGIAVLGVLVFDIGPKLTQRYEREAKPKDPNAFVPQPRTPGAPVEVKFEGVLEKVHDGTPIDDQDEPYRYLVQSLSRMDSALVNKEAKTVDYKYYSKMPVEMRGQTCKIMALFLKSSPIRVDSAPGGVQFIHRTYLADLSGTEGYVVDLLEPTGENLKERTLVGLSGVFLKLGTYEGKKGPVQAPLFVGKSLHVIHERIAENPVLNLSTGMILGLACAMMVFILVLTSLIFRQSRPSVPKGPALSLDTLKS